MMGDSDEVNFPDRQVSKLRKAFANNISANIKLSSGFLDGLLGP